MQHTGLVEKASENTDVKKRSRPTVLIFMLFFIAAIGAVIVTEYVYPELQSSPQYGNPVDSSAAASPSPDSLIIVDNKP